jgi:hypothetical protein
MEGPFIGEDMKKSIRVYNWSPNGTNDIEILDESGEVIDSLPEALFGLNIGRVDFQTVGLKQVLKYIAVSPVNDGLVTVSFFKKHFNF